MSNSEYLAGTLALEQIKSDIVTGTLDKLNSPGSGKGKSSSGSSMKDVYDFSKTVLSSYYEDKGSIINTLDAS